MVLPILPNAVDIIIKKYRDANKDTGTQELVKDVLSLSEADYPGSTPALNWINSNFDTFISAMANGYTTAALDIALPTKDEGSYVNPSVNFNGKRVSIPNMIHELITSEINDDTPYDSLASLSTKDITNDNKHQMEWVESHQHNFLSAIVNGYLIISKYLVKVTDTPYYITTSGTYVRYTDIQKMSDTDKLAFIFTEDQLNETAWWPYAVAVTEADTDLFPEIVVDPDLQDNKWETSDDGADNDLTNDPVKFDTKIKL